MAVAGLVSFSAALMAQEEATTAVAKEGNNRVYFGGSWTHNKIKPGTETYNTADFGALNFNMKSHPWTGFLGYELEQAEGLYAKAEIVYGGGEIKLKSGDTKLMYQHTVGGSAVGGYTFAMGSDVKVTPYAGIKYVQKELDTKTGASSTVSSASIKEKSWWIPFGVAAKWQVLPELEAGLVVEGQYAAKRQAEVTKVTAVDGATATVAEKAKAKAKRRVDFSIELPIKYQVNSEWDVVLTPAYTSDIFKAKSSVDTGAFIAADKEVKNTAFGAKIELGCNF